MIESDVIIEFFLYRFVIQELSTKFVIVFSYLMSCLRSLNTPPKGEHSTIGSLNCVSVYTPNAFEVSSTFVNMHGVILRSQSANMITESSIWYRNAFGWVARNLVKLRT